MKGILTFVIEPRCCKHVILNCTKIIQESCRINILLYQDQNSGEMCATKAAKRKKFSKFPR